jgi:hypothetical protein
MSSQTKLIKDILSIYNTILENKEVEETTDSLRSTIKSLGYTEKGSELTSGGNVNDKITELVAEILSQYKKTNPNVNVKITAGNDKYHQNLKYTSEHKLGNAIDLTISPYNGKNANDFKNILNDFKSKDSKFSYIDEYTNPSQSSTGGHFHLQYGEKVSPTSTSSDSYSNTSSDTSDTSNSSNTSNTSDTSNDEYLKKREAFKQMFGKVISSAIGVNENVKNVDMIKNKSYKKIKLEENIQRIKGLL